MPRIEPQAPDVISFILVDTIHRDPATNKCYLLGTYSVIVAARFPHVQEHIHVYTSLVGGHGKTAVKLFLVDEQGRMSLCASKKRP